MSSKHVSITRSSNFISHANPVGTRLRRNRFVLDRAWGLDSNISRYPIVFQRRQLDFHTFVNPSVKTLFRGRRKRKWTFQYRHVSETTAGIHEDIPPPPRSPRWTKPKFSLSSTTISPTKQNAKLDVLADRGSKSSLSTSESSGQPPRRAWGAPKFLGAATKQDHTPSPPRESGWKRPMFSTSRIPTASSTPRVHVLDAPVNRGWGLNRIFAPEDKDDMLKFKLPDTKVDEDFDPWRHDIDIMSSEDSSQYSQKETNDNREPATVSPRRNHRHYASKRAKPYFVEDSSSRAEARLIKEDILEPVMHWRKTTAELRNRLRSATLMISPNNPRLGRTLQDHYATLYYLQMTTYNIAREIARTYSLRKLSPLEPWLITSMRITKLYVSGPFAAVYNNRASLVEFCKDSQFNMEVMKNYGLDYTSSEAFRKSLATGESILTDLYSRNYLLDAELQMLEFRDRFFKYFSTVKRHRERIHAWFSDKRWGSEHSAYGKEVDGIVRKFYLVMEEQWNEIYKYYMELEGYRANSLLEEMPEVDYRKLRRRIRYIQRL